MHSLACMWTPLQAFVQRHPALSYFVLTFTISWGGLLVVAGPSLFSGTTMTEFERLLPFWVPVLVLGPSASGLLLTWVVGGRAGLRDYRARLLRWRVGGRWYAAALLTAPVYFLVTELLLSAFDSQFLPGIFTAEDKAGLVSRGLFTAFAAGVFEELGWTGFAIPTLRRRFSPLATGLIVGGLWGAWHVLPKIWGAAAHGLMPYLPLDLACALVGLTGFRILMVWVYDRTESLFLAMLMHLALTGSTLILQPLLTGAPLMRLSVALSLAPWVIVVALLVIRSLRGPSSKERHALSPTLSAAGRGR